MQIPSHSSEEIARAMLARAGLTTPEEKVIEFALAHLPGSTRATPVLCRHCQNTGLAKIGFRRIPCIENHTEDGVECCECHQSATEYVFAEDDGEVSLLPFCDAHKAKLAKNGHMMVRTRS